MSPMDYQEGQATAPVELSLIEDHKREQRARLIKALSRFKPRDASPQQFYNCVREQCIIHNCSIDEGLERAAITWPSLSQLQRDSYESQRHAELPIPVPRHLLYRAFQKERNGLWSLGRSSTGGKHRYTLESYKPPPKPSRLKAQLQENRPKYDNRLDLAPKVAARRVPPISTRKLSRSSPSSFRTIRSITPPKVPKRVRSTRDSSPTTEARRVTPTRTRKLSRSLPASFRTIRSITPPEVPKRVRSTRDSSPTTEARRVPPKPTRKLSRSSPSSFRTIRSITPPGASKRVRSSRDSSPTTGIEITKKTRRRHRKLKKLSASESSKSSDEKGTLRKKVTKRKVSKAKRLAKRLAQQKMDMNNDVNWEKAIGSVRRRLRMRSRSNY